MSYILLWLWCIFLELFVVYVVHDTGTFEGVLWAVSFLLAVNALIFSAGRR